MKRLGKRICAIVLAAFTVSSSNPGAWSNWGIIEAKADTFDTTLSAQDIVTALGNGWNLGDTMDCHDTSKTGQAITATTWGNAAPNQATFDAVAAYGFDSVRIPVSWSAHLTEESIGTYHPDIEDAWLAEVKNVVDMALNSGLYVVMDIHHPFEKWDTLETWGDPTNENVETATSYATILWTEIATYFKNYDHRLVFESFNEIRDRASNDWNGTSDMYANVNSINAACLNAIRATGGNNVERMVLLPTYAHSAGYNQVTAWEAPTSLACGEAVGRIGIAIHAYEPANFAFTASGTDTFTDTTMIDTLMIRMQNKGVPFVFTEWGSLNKGNTLERAKHANYYVNACLNAGGSLMWWDNSIFVTSEYKSETYGLIRRLNTGNNSLTTPFPMIVGAMKDSAVGFSDIYIDEATANTEAAGATVAVEADTLTGLHYVNISASTWSAPRILSDATLDWSKNQTNGTVRFAYRIPTGGLTDLTLRLHDVQSDGSLGIQKATVSGLIADGEWHECSVALSKFTTWGGTTNSSTATGNFDFAKVKGIGFELNSGELDVNQIRMEDFDSSRQVSVWEEGNVPSGFSLAGATGTVATDTDGSKYISCKSESGAAAPWFVRVVANGNGRFNLATAYEQEAKLSVTLRVASGTSPVDVDFCLGDDTYTTTWTYHTVEAVSDFNDTEWATYEVPLSAFENISDWSKISAIGLRYHTTGETYGVDDTLHAKDIKVIWEEAEETEVIYNVDIAWGDMQFDYHTTDNTWSVADSKSNTIRVTNHGDSKVNASFAFTADASQTSLGSGSFTANNVEVSSVTVAGEASKTVTFLPTGSISSETTEYTKIGDITVTIGEAAEPDKLICLTFDDGPSSTTMDGVMDVLAAYDAKATFFVKGNMIDANTRTQEALKRAVSEGHEIGNHSWSHPSMGDASFTEDMILEEINLTQEKVQEVAGVTPKYFRPPNLSVSNLLFATVELPFVTMSADTYDYQETATAQSVYDNFVTGVKDGAIILQHCYEGNTRSVEALEMILTWCQDHGYKAVTVSEMFEANNITPEAGKVYRSSTQVHLDTLW